MQVEELKILIDQINALDVNDFKKLTDALNQRKADIAQSIYSPQDQEESEEQETENEDE